MADKPDSDSKVVRLDLRSGRSIWEFDPPPSSPSARLRASGKTDVIIVGAGITGSFVAERLTRSGRKVVVLDRHEPRTASTAASTSLLQWEIDAPMLMLEDRLGFDAAALIYRRSFEAVRSICSLVETLGPGARLAPRNTLYLSGSMLDRALLNEEIRLRHRAGLPGRLLDEATLAREFGFGREGAILSPGSAEADPVRLARLAMQCAIARGAEIFSPATVVDYDCRPDSATIRTSDGFEVEGNAIILANGYEMPPFVPAAIHRIRSTFAIATKAQPPHALWPDRTLLWEASQSYLYARTTEDDRIILGGEDEDLVDAGERDAALPGKVDTLVRHLRALFPGARSEVDAAWAGFFGETRDGLPLIGAVPGQPRCYAAFGYGGNGITFSAIAAELIARLLAGEADPIQDVFTIDRDV